MTFKEGPADPAELVIAILNWNGYALTRDCIESLARLSGPAHRILVVDNGSAEPEAARLAGEFPGRVESLLCMSTTMISSTQPATDLSANGSRFSSLSVFSTAEILGREVASALDPTFGNDGYPFDRALDGADGCQVYRRAYRHERTAGRCRPRHRWCRCPHIGAGALGPVIIRGRRPSRSWCTDDGNWIEACRGETGKKDGAEEVGRPRL
jgi:hypothetical protein